MNDVSLPVAFAAGILSFLSPCVLPIAPVYLSSMISASALRGHTSRWYTLLHALSFVIGFSLIFAILGASFGLLGHIIPVLLLRRISGVLLIVFGIFLLAINRVSWLNYELHFSGFFSEGSGYLRSFLLGISFSLAWTPCVGPVLSGILTLASNSQTAWQGLYMLLVYSLGLGLPFIIAGLALGAVTPLIRWLSRKSTIVSLMSGLLLIAMGILTLTNKFIFNLSP